MDELLQNFISYLSEIAFLKKLSFLFDNFYYLIQFYMYFVAAVESNNYILIVGNAIVIALALLSRNSIPSWSD